jgi:RNA polymerase sigma-70 factor (ECF subfamily)
MPAPSRWIASEDLQAAIALLPPLHAEAIKLFAYEGLSWHEISRRLKVPSGTVGARLFRGKRQLARILSEHLPSAVREQVPRWRR